MSGFVPGPSQQVYGIAAVLLHELLRGALGQELVRRAGQLDEDQQTEIRAVMHGIGKAAAAYRRGGLSSAEVAGERISAGEGPVPAQWEREPLLTAADAAEELSLSPTRIGQLARQGRIDAEKLGTQWAFRPSDIAAYRHDTEEAA